VSLGTLLVLGIFSLLMGGIIPPRLRGWLILAGSLAGIYWLQTASPIRQLDFWLPSAALLLTVLTWGITRSRSTPDSPARRSDILAAMVILAAVLLIALLRYADPLCCLTATTPPSLWKVATFLATGGVAAALLLHTPEARGRLASGMIVLLLVVFLVLKSPILARWSSAGLRLAGGQEPALAAALDLAWVGFSFLAFRLIHVLRDYQSGRLPAYGLSEFVSYALFYPAYLAGPIDRIQRFTADLRQATSPTANQGDTRLADLLDGGQRILVGLVKKFVVADSLALIALNAQNAAQVSSPVWAWLLLYAYGLRIYFDFAGYTDIALGLARWLHIKLPENFDRPYLKLNLTAFWNSWHMTLAGWFRAYVFNPLTRALRQSQAHFAPG
jgi:D-alanyl-lipoteichoic acid acyltransferase DltB (MBOAT superfamily)